MILIITLIVLTIVIVIVIVTVLVLVLVVVITIGRVRTPRGLPDSCWRATGVCTLRVHVLTDVYA